MNLSERDVQQLVEEHRILVMQYAKTQVRCGELILRQTAEIAQLRSQAMQQRAAIIIRDSALAWAGEDRLAMEASIPGLPKRAALAHRVERLVERVQELMREKLLWQRKIAHTEVADARAEQNFDERLEASLIAADLVICQTGCLSHGAYWRVENHCKRTGKACVVVERAEMLKIIRMTK